MLGPSKIITYAVMISALTVSFALLARTTGAQQRSRGSIIGTVKDQEGASVSGAQVALVHSQQAVLRTTESDASGHFTFDNIAVGTYEIRITQAGFGTRRTSVQVGDGKAANLDIILEPASVSSQVTVTAETGQAQDKDRVPQAVNVISEKSIQQRATAVLAQVADEEVGLSLQRTSPTIAGIFVRAVALTLF